MILQALKEYFDRKDELPREGWELKEIPFIIVLDHDGNPLEIENTIEIEEKKKRAKMFLVPMTVKRSVGIASNLGWDNIEYTLGYDTKGKPERVINQHKAFIDRITALGTVDDQGIKALKRFLEKPDKITILQSSFSERWQEMSETSGANVSFRLATEHIPIIARPAVRTAIDRLRSSEEANAGTCLVTGETSEPLALLHSAIKGVWGAQSTGANIVSFNLDAFTSYGKKQGLNAPVSKAAAFAYTTALNHLLSKDSRQRMQVGDTSTIFWSDRDNAFEEQMPLFFSEPPKDDPDRNIEAVKALHEAVIRGSYSVSDARTRFFVLGLAPNAARLAIRFWRVGTVPEMAARIDAHFQDLALVHGPKERSGLSLFRLLASTAALGKSENIPPNLGGEIMRSIFDGTPYPATLLQGVVRRLRAEHDVTYPRAALAKACINRSIRSSNPRQEKEVTMSLDATNNNIGYRLGRLFAALEKIQGDAQPGLNATIRDRFYGAASGTPVTVFGNLMRLKNHHLSKLSDGLRITRERQLQDIMEGIPSAGFPAHLDLADQGRFAVGYYHQMQAFFTKKSDSTETGKE